MKSSYILLFFFFMLLSCEDVIEVDNGFEQAQISVDAWLDNMDREQTIRITQSQDYFDNSFAVGVEGAQVRLMIEGQQEIIFTEKSSGEYTWMPTEGSSIGEVGDNYILTIEFNDNIYTGNSTMKRVPQIDSIAQIYEEKQLGFPEGNYGELFVTDFPGQHDTYWAKTWKNGELLNKPLEILVIYDATFDPGNALDGVQFIFPIRRGINPIPDDFDNIDDIPPPYVPGDSIYVELHSITNDAFRFWTIAQEQMVNGENGIFALPVANTRGNVINQATKERILGFFNVSAVANASKLFE